MNDRFTRRAIVCSGAKGNRCDRRGDGGALSDSTDFGLLGEQSSQKLEIPCFGRR